MGENKVENFLVKKEVLIATLQYLETQPIKQAIGLYQALQQSAPADVEVSKEPSKK